MADEPQTQPTPDPTPDPNDDGQPTPPAAPQFRPITSQGDFDRLVGARLREERERATKQYADYDDLKTKAAQFDELQEAQKTELEREREAREKAEQHAAQVEMEACETRLRAAIVAEAAKPDRRIVDLDAVVEALTGSKSDLLERDDDGVPTNVAKAMDALLEARPYLVVQEPSRRVGVDQGARQAGGAKQMTEAELKSLYASGKHDEIAKARREGRLSELLGAR